MIGLCCHYLDENGKNISEEKILQLNRFKSGKYSSSDIQRIYINNSLNLFRLVKKANENGFKVFRFSSNLFPLYEFCKQQYINNEVKHFLSKTGQYVLDNNMRLSCHPDQFVVLSSDNPNVILNSIEILKYHADVFELMSLPENTYHLINIHGGKKNNSDVLIKSINNLPSYVKNRLTLENDERSYNVQELYKVHEHTGVPIVFDTHHHNFNSGNLSLEDAFLIIEKTWSEKPLTHLSNTEPELIRGSFTDRRKHSKFVHYIPEIQLQKNNSDKIDIDFEFKMKNLAIKKAEKDFKIRISI